MNDPYGRISQALINCDACLVTVLNRNQEIVWFNATMEKEFGSLDDFRGRKCYEAFAGESEPHAGCAVQTAFKSGHLERTVAQLGGKPHLVLAIPLDEDHIVEAIIEIPEKEYTP